MIGPVQRLLVLKEPASKNITTNYKRYWHEYI